MKNLLIAIVIVIALCGLLVVVAGYKGTGIPVEAQDNTPLPGRTIPVAQAIISKDYAKDMQADLNAILDTSKLVVKQGDFSKTFGQFGAILALNDDPDPKKNTLAKFMKNALRGLSANADIDTAKGLIMAIASMDRSALQGKNSVSEGLVQLMERNMYGQLKTSADVKTSSLRSLLFMLQGADVDLTLKLLGLNTHIPLLYFIASPDHPAGVPGTVYGITKNVAGWAIGEIVTAQQWGREGKIKLDDKYVRMDQFQALDWVFYKKSYHFKFLGLTLMKFKGLVGMLSNPLVQIFMPSSITDPFPAFVDLAGGMTAAEYHGGQLDGFTTTSWKDRYGTAGRRHKLFALFGPIMEYYWNAQQSGGKARTGDMVALLAGMNEIDPSEYSPLKRLGITNPRATFRRLDKTGHKTVMQTLEDSGLLIALLKHDDGQAGDMLAPALDMLISLTRALNTKDSAPADYKKNHPEFRGNTLFDVAFTELNLAGIKKDPEEINRMIDKSITTLFTVQKGESKNAIAKLSDLVGALAKAADDKTYIEAVRIDLVKIIQATQNLLYHDDFKRLLPGLDYILSMNDNPDPGRNTLARFITKALHAIEPLSDGASIKALLIALLSIDKAAMEAHGITEGLIYMAHHNMYGQKCETADINTSELRSFFFLVENADRHLPLTVNGSNTGIDLMKLIDSPDHPAGEPGTVRDQTTNIVEWYIGELVTALRWAHEGKIMLDGRYVTLNQYQAYDWFLFKKRYQLIGMGRKPLNFNGVSGILSNEIVQAFLPPGARDTVMTLIELAGGMTAAEYAGGKYSGFTTSSWKGRYGTGGQRHKVLALFNPILDYLWNSRNAQGVRRAVDFIRLTEGLNEIPVENYQPLFRDGIPNPNATLRNDKQFAGKSVMKAVEDYNLLRIISRSHGPNDNGMLAPGLDLLILIVGKLNEKDSASAEYKKNHPQFQGNTTLDVLFDQMQIKGFKMNSGSTEDPVAKTIHTLFVAPQGESQNAVAKLRGYVKVLEDVIAVIRGPEAGQSEGTQARAIEDRQSASG